MGRILALAAVAVVIAGGLALALRAKPRTDSSISAEDENRAAELLADKSRIWWQGHKLPMPAKHTLIFRAPDKMGTFPEAPAGCPVMPVEVARALAAGRARMSGDHPFQGRPVLLIDMRLRSIHLKEHIADSLNVPYNRMAEAFSAGALKGLDHRTIVVLYGEIYPHFDATAHFRVEKFEAYYCLEGGLEAWKAKGYPVTVNPSVAEYLAALEGEKVVGGQNSPADPADVGPAALKALLDQGVDPLVIFVGDASTFTVGHLPKAERVTLEELNARFEKEPKDRLIAVYCGCCEGSAKGLSGIAVERLRQMKFTRLLHLSGHLKAWKDAGYPVETN